MLPLISAQLSQTLDAKLVQELVGAYEQTKRNFYLGHLRPTEVEGGRFCEAAFRLLEQITGGSFTPIGTQLDTTRLIRNLEQTSTASHPDSVRLHIPRALRMVYDIRNKRDAAHLADGIDPNLQDATLVVSTLDWVLAEFLRLRHNVPANDAQRIVECVITRAAPVVQEFGNFLKVLRTDLKASEVCLVLLYHRGNDGGTFAELSHWVRPSMRANLQRTLNGLLNDKAFVHLSDGKYYITRTGQLEVELCRLIHFN
jgi:hypothetical protein